MRAGLFPKVEFHVGDILRFKNALPHRGLPAATVTHIPFAAGEAGASGAAAHNRKRAAAAAPAEDDARRTRQQTAAAAAARTVEHAATAGLGGSAEAPTAQAVPSASPVATIVQAQNEESGGVMDSGDEDRHGPSSNTSGNGGSGKNEEDEHEEEGDGVEDAAAEEEPAAAERDLVALVKRARARSRTLSSVQRVHDDGAVDFPVTNWMVRNNQLAIPRGQGDSLHSLLFNGWVSEKEVALQPLGPGAAADWVCTRLNHYNSLSLGGTSSLGTCGEHCTPSTLQADCSVSHARRKNTAWLPAPFSFFVLQGLFAAARCRRAALCSSNMQAFTTACPLPPSHLSPAQRHPAPAASLRPCLPATSPQVRAKVAQLN